MEKLDTRARRWSRWACHAPQIGPASGQGAQADRGPPQL